MKRYLSLLAVSILFVGAGCGQSAPAPAAAPVTNGAANGGAEPAPAGLKKEVSISGFAFLPASVTVDAGTTVVWTNNDSMAHTATADDGSFDTGSIGKGQGGSFTFAKPGTYPYHCTFHPSMKGVIIVR